MKKNTRNLKIKIIATAVVLTVLTFTQLPAADNSQNDSLSETNGTYFCLGNDEWENS